MKANLKNLAENIISIAIITAVFFFFFKAYNTHWNDLKSYPLKINYAYIIFSFLFVIISYLLTTLGWFITLNSLSARNKITIYKSIAVVNSSNLTKYLPGKIWSYAFQMFWLAKEGFSKSLVLYVNLTNAFISLMTYLVLGVGYLVFLPGKYLFKVTWLFLIVLIAFDLIFIRYNAPVFNSLISLINKLFKRNIKYFNTSTKLLLSLHGIYFLAAFCFGLSAYFASVGIGFYLAKTAVYSVMSSMMIADVIGFIAFIIPGGLGVREGMMYYILNGISPKTMALILPVVTRVISMSVDISLGIISFILLAHRGRKRRRTLL